MVNTSSFWWKTRHRRGGVPDGVATACGIEVVAENQVTAPSSARSRRDRVESPPNFDKLHEGNLGPAVRKKGFTRFITNRRQSQPAVGRERCMGSFASIAITIRIDSSRSSTQSDLD